MNSAAAIFAAITEPMPVSSAYRLDMSVSTPILTLICWALAEPHASAMARTAKLIVFFIVVPPCSSWFYG